MTPQLPESSKPLRRASEGRILKVVKDTGSLSKVVVDNGVTHTITILSRPDQLPDLLASDMDAIREHLVTRKPGRFRKKVK